MPAKAAPSISPLKALDILEVLSIVPEGLPLTEIAAETGLSKSTCYRFLQAMASKEYVVRNDHSKIYRMGYRVLRLTNVLGTPLLVREAARPVLERLRDQTGETVHLFRLDGTVGVYVEKWDTVHSIGVLSRVGKHITLHSSSCGKVLLAWQPPELIEKMIEEQGLPRRTPATITDRGRLLQDLQIIRARGFALDMGESREGVQCVAAPVFYPTVAECSFSISVAGPVFRFSPEKAEAVAPLVKEAAELISEKVRRTRITLENGKDTAN